VKLLCPLSNASNAFFAAPTVTKSAASINAWDAATNYESCDENDSKEKQTTSQVIK
jgi:hypothetical protein